MVSPILSVVAGGAVGALGNLTGSYLNTVLIRPSRSIGMILPDCAIDERATDRLTITRHPVETGSKPGDHSFMEPAIVQLRWGWSNSSPANTLASGLGPLGVFGFGSEDYVKTVYNQLLALQRSGEPFVLSTGKRIYPSMLLISLSQETNESSEYALITDLICEEIIIYSTTVVAAPAQATQAQPQQTSPTQAQGTQQATPSPAPTAAPAGSVATQLGAPAVTPSTATPGSGSASPSTGSGSTAPSGSTPTGAQYFIQST